MNREEKKKEMSFNFIEETRRNESDNSLDFRTTILFHPSPTSLETKMYEKRFSLTNYELVHIKDGKTVERIKENAAIEVFSKFYNDNFIQHD